MKNANRQSNLAAYDKATCEECGHLLRADDRRYAQCMDCGSPVPERKRRQFKGQPAPWSR